MDSALRNSLRERAGSVCEYCLVPEEFNCLPFQADHIIAEKHGGLSTSENLAWSCFDCNAYEGPNIAGVDPETGAVVQLFHPRSDKLAEHFVKHGAEIRGVTPAGRATIVVLRINLERRLAFREALQHEGLMR